MSLLSFSTTKNVDRGSYEKLSIRDSARSLKKYGSTSTKAVTKSENYLKHFVSNSDTLQGIALKYNVTIEQIRRANKLWASDSLFLREFLLIPQTENTANKDLLSISTGADFFDNDTCSQTSSPTEDASACSIEENSNQNHRISMTTSSTRSSFDDVNISEFLSKIDASIASTKEVVKKVTSNSEYGTEFPIEITRRRPQSRLKQQQQQQQQNNNLISVEQPAQQPLTSYNNSIPLNTIVSVQQGKKIRTSLEIHEQQQNEIFEL